MNHQKFHLELMRTIMRTSKLNYGDALEVVRNTYLPIEQEIVRSEKNKAQKKEAENANDASIN
jgi:hypothetical protein